MSHVYTHHKPKGELTRALLFLSHIYLPAAIIRYSDNVQIDRH